ncbi:MAG: hypothetical protein ACTTGZ_05960 [Treponema sp.]
MGIANFNKIIDIDFCDMSGNIIAQLKCPQFGRKPNITLTGALYGSDIPNDFDITIKNFYLGNVLSNTNKVRVYAGYANKKRMTLEASIAYMHQESPGPESSTVIHCTYGESVKWLSATININLDKGYRIETALKMISDKLGFKPPVLSEYAMQLTSPVSFQFQGLCKDAISHLKASFDGISITQRSGALVAYEVGKDTPLVVHRLHYLSSPPVIKSGAEGLLASATVTAPWEPLLKPGDIVTFNSAYYQSTEYLKTFTQAESAIEITILQFHFSTVENANEMIIDGITRDNIV